MLGGFFKLRTAKFQSDTKLRNTSFYEIIILIIIAELISLSFAYIIEETVIHNTGKIIPEITAESGYWEDIQDAVNLAASSGAGIVHIPEDTWNFVNVGESWTGYRVTIPAGVSVFGAPTERHPNGSVVEWKTILKIPWETANNGSTWFKIDGNSDPAKPSRFSDMALIGYRSFNSSSNTNHVGVRVEEVIDFRVDHCLFEHITQTAVLCWGHWCCGVIDHCEFINIHGIPDPYGLCDIYYGVTSNCEFGEFRWDGLEEIAGKYTNYTVFIEDCYFTRWRSCVGGNLGAHYVCRYCYFNDTFAKGEIDAHPTYESNPAAPNRLAEIYGNLFDTVAEPWGTPRAIEIFSGAAMIFNNTVIDPDYYAFASISGAAPWNHTYYDPEVYIWNNTYYCPYFIQGGAVEGEDYFQYKPGWYTPYQYPHPLTLK